MQLSKQTKQPQGLGSPSFEPLLATNFERCLAEQRARRASSEQASQPVVSPYGWNPDRHCYEPTRDDEIDMGFHTYSEGSKHDGDELPF